jgi:hypothetical protein
VRHRLLTRRIDADSHLPRLISMSVVVALVIGAHASAQGVVMQRNISLAMAKTMAEATLAECKSKGIQHRGSRRRSLRSDHRHVARRTGERTDDGDGAAQGLHGADVPHVDG